MPVDVPVDSQDAREREEPASDPWQFDIRCWVCLLHGHHHGPHLPATLKIGEAT
jgi:hypothetical protein